VHCLIEKAILYVLSVLCIFLCCFVLFSFMLFIVYTVIGELKITITHNVVVLTVAELIELAHLLIQPDDSCYFRFKRSNNYE